MHFSIFYTLFFNTVRITYYIYTKNFGLLAILYNKLKCLYTYLMSDGFMAYLMLLLLGKATFI